MPPTRAPEAIQSFLQDLACARCGNSVPADVLQAYCGCGGMYLARYNLKDAAQSMNLRGFAPGASLPPFWGWAEVLPVLNPAFRRGLGEGCTPLQASQRAGPELGLGHVQFKDEGVNPGGSFKARGMAVAVARAAELGARALALPSAGNAGASAAAYGAAWDLPVVIAFPEGTPELFVQDAAAHGAECHIVSGSIADAGAWLTRRDLPQGTFFLNTLKEPYRVEGKKTLGYELVAQLGGRWPDVVIYPTGGGTGLIGMIKAHQELCELGMVSGPPPRWVAVQAEGCAPLVHAWKNQLLYADPWPDPRTGAYGLRVPGTIGDHYILEAIRKDGGTALAVTEPEIESARGELGSLEGMYCAPEAAATWAACRRLAAENWFPKDASVVLFITGNGFRYPEH